jgi:hypothetical protein
MCRRVEALLITRFAGPIHMELCLHPMEGTPPPSWRGCELNLSVRGGPPPWVKANLQANDTP